MPEPIFSAADILLPKKLDPVAYSVVACDQFTSEPDYWNAVRKAVSDKPSTLHMIFPEIELKSPGFDEKISSINKTMYSYLEGGLLEEHKNCFVYIKRKLRDGSVRHGLIGKIDLEGYDYVVGSKTPVRATEGTVLERIPPRVQIRKDAPLELPHIMLLIDDSKNTVIEPLKEKLIDDNKLYDFNLMQNSGSLEGWRLSDEQSISVSVALEKLCVSKFSQPPLQYAVGDGNHSLATAKKCYENLKTDIGDAALKHPSRYALCEIVNLHDNSLRFEAIHRILFDVNTDSLIAHLKSACGLSDEKSGNTQAVKVVFNGEEKNCFFNNPLHTLAVGTLQIALDEYLASNKGEIDYIHGSEVVADLSRKANSIGFILPDMDKSDLFKTVILDGALPRKTFSMGHAWDKRFYFEARKIK